VFDPISWLRVWYVHFQAWRIRRIIVQTDVEIGFILLDAIQKYAPDTEILRNDSGVYCCDDCGVAETLLVRAHANSPLPHEFLCAKCWLDGLLLGLNAEYGICSQSEQP